MKKLFNLLLLLIIGFLFTRGGLSDDVFADIPATAAAADATGGTGGAAGAGAAAGDAGTAAADAAGACAAATSGS